MRTTELLIEALRGLGMELYVEDGTVHGRMTDGGKMPLEAMRLAEELRLCNADAVEILYRENEIRTVEIRDEIDASCWKARIDAGMIEMVGKLVYNKETGVATLRYRPKK